MQVLSVLTAPAYFTDFHLFCLLACRMVNAQHAARDERRFRATPMPVSGLSSDRSFTVTAKVTASPSLPATWSRSTASSPTTRRSTMRWDWQPSGRSRSRARSISIGRPLAPPTETGDLTFACYGMHPIHHMFSHAERSARRGVARVGDGAGLRPESQVQRCRGPHREPATLHREHAGPRLRPSPPSAKRSSTRRRSRHS